MGCAATVAIPADPKHKDAATMVSANVAGSSIQPVASAASAAGIDPDEKDTEVNQDYSDAELMALLLPDGGFPDCQDHFGLQFSRRAFRCWVRQNSPCCAAASVAGACNILLDRRCGRFRAPRLPSHLTRQNAHRIVKTPVCRRTDERAFDQFQVIDFYSKYLIELQEVSL